MERVSSSSNNAIANISLVKGNMNKKQVIPECVKCARLQIDGIWYQPNHAPARYGASYTSAICDECKEAKAKKDRKERIDKLAALANVFGGKLSFKKNIK